MKRLLVIILVVSFLAVVGFFAYRWLEQRKANQESNIETVSASYGELIATIGATGQVRSHQNATLFWKTSGTVEKCVR